MQVNEVVGFAVERSGMSQRAISKKLGHADAWCRFAVHAQAPQLDTVARIAKVAGLAVALVDTRTGDVVATVDPPTD